METAEEPMRKRHLADKLSILCATRPLQYFLIRMLAAVVVFLALSFVVDAIARLSAWVASNDLLTLLYSEPGTSREERDAVIAFADGLPFDLPRLTVLGITLAVLVALQLLATRRLPDGVEAMKSSIVEGPPWPKTWRLPLRRARTLIPWIIIAGTIVELSREVSVSGAEWLLVPLLLAFIVGAVWLAAYAAWMGGLLLTRALPAFVNISMSDLEEAEKIVEEQDREEDARRWPRKNELRLSAAARVFAMPPVALRHGRGRRRHAWWTGTDTTVEALATELVLQALVEAQSLRLVSITDWRRRNPRVIASLPLGEQPRGLAALVAGFHREGLNPGRVVNGKLSNMLDPVSSVDQYATTINIALEDLEHFGAARKDPTGNTWQLSKEKLEHAASAWASRGMGAEIASSPTSPSDGKLGSRPELHEIPRLSSNRFDQRRAAAPSSREFVALRRSIARNLRHQRTTEVELEGMIDLLFVIFQFPTELAERHKYRLPTRWIDPQ